jgi:hypothetical protein
MEFVFVERIRRAAVVLGIGVPRPSIRRARYIISLVLAITLMPAGAAVAAGTLASASVSLSDPVPSHSSSYLFTGSSVDTATAVLCVKAVWSTTATGDAAPAGFSGVTGSVDATNSSLINGSSTNWSLAKTDGTGSTGQKNIWQYTNSASGVTPAGTTARTFDLTGLTNSATADTAFYFQLSTYSNVNCSSGLVDAAIVAFTNTSGQQMSLTVDQTLSFSINSIGQGVSCDGTTTTAASTSNAIPFGSVTSATNGVVCQDLAAATNAGNGYAISLRYTGQLNNGQGDHISDFGSPNSAPTDFSAAGTEAYGYTTDDASLSTCAGSCNTDRFTNDPLTHQGWAGASTSDAEIAYESAGVATTHYKIGHQVGVASTTNPGTYTTTIVYTCTPVY